MKGTPELMQPILYESDNSDLLAKVSSLLLGYMSSNKILNVQVSNQLMSALASIESMQEGEASIVHCSPVDGAIPTRILKLQLSGTPIKIAEKRRNKFEFIRFGRK